MKKKVKFFKIFSSPLFKIWLFGILTFFILFASWIVSAPDTKFDTTSQAAGSNISLEDRCSDGYYDKCSRAPKCGGKSYDEVANLPMPDANACMGNGKEDRSSKGCAGLVPLCCYEVERTGDPLKCVGYWERLWCHPNQCAKIDLEKGRECNDGNPGKCLCGHAAKSWCLEIDGHSVVPYIPVEVRLGLQQPTATLPPPQPTSTPQPTATNGSLSPTSTHRSPTPTKTEKPPKDTQPPTPTKTEKPTKVKKPQVSASRAPTTAIPTPIARRPFSPLPFDLDINKTVQSISYGWNKFISSVKHFTQTVLP